MPCVALKSQIKTQGWTAGRQTGFGPEWGKTFQSLMSPGSRSFTGPLFLDVSSLPLPRFFRTAYNLTACICYLLFHNESLQNFIAQKNMHVLFHSSCGPRIWAQISCVLCFRVFQRTAIKMLARAGISSDGLTGEGLNSKLTYTVVGRVQCLEGNWSEDLTSSPSVGQKPLSVPCQMGLSNLSILFIKTSKRVYSFA